MSDYVVRGGDTVGKIAARKLGNVAFWKQIVELNQLTDPNFLLVGQVLRLPDRAKSPTPTNVSLLAANTEPAPTMPASVAMARGFMFILFEQLPDIGVGGKIIRKVAAVPANFALSPANPAGTLSQAEHVLNTNPSASQLLSASDRATGAPTIKGEPMLIDAAKIRAAGGQIYTTAEVVADLRRFVTANPGARAQVEKLISVIEKIEGEVLIKGGVPAGGGSKPTAAHVAYIRSAEDLWNAFRNGAMSRAELESQLAALEKAYAKAKIIGRVGRVLTVVGVILTVKDLAAATDRSIEQKSMKPLAAETIRQVGGWGGAAAGAKIGGVVGAAFGIETGPGAIVTGAIGAIVFGAAGYFGADWVADKISPN
jgi:murein DD-endopeptidase MepM/ murein hydrolase activator NlpD